MQTHPTTFESFTDHTGKPVKFQLTFLDLGNKFCVSAFQMTEAPVPRTFHGYDSGSMEQALTKVRNIIKEELNTVYFETEQNTPFYHLKGDYFRGHVGADEDGEPFLLVDGKPMTLEDFGEFLKPYYGFRIEFKVLD